MIATLDARRLALEIAGRWRDEEAWGEAVREVRASHECGSVWISMDQYGSVWISMDQCRIPTQDENKRE